jgi:hypothetical protein
MMPFTGSVCGMPGRSAARLARTITLFSMRCTSLQQTRCRMGQIKILRHNPQRPHSRFRNAIPTGAKI